MRKISLTSVTTYRVLFHYNDILLWKYLITIKSFCIISAAIDDVKVDKRIIEIAKQSYQKEKEREREENKNAFKKDQVSRSSRFLLNQGAL